MGLPQTVSFDETNRTLVIIDQTLLPNKLELLHLSNLEDICDAIRTLKVRGAPAIGVAAAIGLYCVCSRFETDLEDVFIEKTKETAEIINSTRPTAKNLSWALQKMLKVVDSNTSQGTDNIKNAMKKCALQILEEDVTVCKAIGEYGAALINNGDCIMTVCNAGALAAVKYGTALAPIYSASESGKSVSVYSLETRPLLQGARLSSFELTENGIDTTLICDNMAASVMASGKIKAVFTGCDRVAANGDAANKIGTLMLAILAKHYNIPFYICAPYSTIDFETRSGNEIVIEERNDEEIRSLWYKQPMVTDKAKIYNPAFDVTPAELITAFITEKGIKKPKQL